jgi:hypothetical protein
MLVGTLLYLLGVEEGRVKINWSNMPEGVMGLDVLKDWIHELEEIYEAKHAEVFKQGE